MFFKHYLNQKRAEKRALEEQERLFMEMVNKEEKSHLEEMGEKMAEESMKETVKEEETDDGGPIIELEKLEDKDYYDKLMKKIKQIQRREQRKQMAAAFGLTAFLTFLTTGLVLHANPFHFFIQVVEFVDGKMSTKSNWEVREIQNSEKLEFEIYQVGYMTEDYVLMTEENVDAIYKMRYYKDSEHFVMLSQASINDTKNFSLTDDTEYQTLLIDGMEYFYNYETSMATSTLFFIKDNTSISIKGTVHKEEILQIANGLYKEHE